jgi:hypothetical protein
MSKPEVVLKNLRVCPRCNYPLFLVDNCRPLTRERFRLRNDGHLHDPNVYAELHVCDNGHEAELCHMRACDMPNCTFGGGLWLLPYAQHTYPATVL